MAKKNRLSDLQDHLFEQLERMNDDGLKGEQLQEEIERSKSMSGIAKDITANAKLVLDAQKAAWEWNKAPGDIPKMLEAE